MPTPAAGEVIVPFQIEGPNGLEAPTLLATMGPYSYSSPAVKFYMDYSVSQAPASNYSRINLTIRAYNDTNATTSSNYAGSGTHRGSVDGIDSDVVTHAATPFLPSGFAAGAKRWDETDSSVQIPHDSNGAHDPVKVRMLIRYGSIDDEFTATVSLPTMAGVPNKINTVNIAEADTDSFVVSYGTPQDNGSPITGFQVQWDQSSNFSSPTTKDDNASPTSVTGLGDAARYYVRVRAQNAVGNAPWSTGGEYQETTPKAPVGVSVGTPTTTSLTVIWDAPGPVVSGYEVDYSTSSTFASGVTTVPLGNVLTTKISGLASATRYYFRVRAKNGGGESANSATVSAETTPGQVAGVTVTAPTVSTLHVEWVAPGPNVTSYDIQYDEDPAFASPITKSSVASPYDITDLDDATRYYVRVRANNGGGSGAYSAPGVEAYTVPREPTGLTLSEPTTLSVRATWASPGPNISGYELDYSTSSTFASGVTTLPLGNVLTTVISGLTPGTTYYVRVRAVNPGGTSDNSTAASQATLPSVGPGFSVSSSASGTSANLAFTPPGGVSGVTQYDWERRLQGTTTPVTPGSSLTPSAVVSDLMPGATYEWRASAWIGPSYQSPWTNWLAVKQEKPNTAPGEYFDGDTPDTPDLTYQWGTDGTGAPNASISTALASGVEGWEMAGATGVLYRITGGLLSDHAARAQINVDPLAAGVRVGQRAEALYRSTIIEAEAYVASIHVSPSRSQRLAAELTWLNDSGLVMSRVLGAPAVVPGDQWTRLAAGATAPAGAKYAVVSVIDVTGTGWSLWHGGEFLDVDGAMISLHALFPYFDGDTDFDGDYVYEWTGVANASTSKRTEFALAAPASLAQLDGPNVPAEYALIDPGCVPPPPPPRPPAVDNICVEGATQWQRFYYKIPARKVAEWIDMVTTLYVTNANTDKPIKEARIRYYENPDNLTAAELDKSEWVSEQIISYMPADTRFALDGVTQRVWASVKGAKAVRADHLLYGTGGNPPTWPVLSCGIAYVVSVETPLEQKTQVVVQASLTART